MRGKICSFAMVILVAGTVFVSGAAENRADLGGKTIPLESGLHAFFSGHCIDCHDDSTRKGGLSLEALGDSVTDATAGGWQRVLEQIERGTMPPAKKKQPSAGDRESVVAMLEEALVAQAQSRPVGDTTVLRRLTRTEYRRTLEDLLCLDLRRNDPTKEFPEDTRTHGFATVGEKLVTSSFLLRHYLTSAKDVIERAVVFGERPEQKTLSFLPPFAAGTFSAESSWYARQKTQPQPFQTLNRRPHGLNSPSAYTPVEGMKKGVPLDGWYSIRVRAEAKFRHADLGARRPGHTPFLFDPAQPLRMAMRMGSLARIDALNADAVQFALTGGPGDFGVDGSDGGTVAVWDVPDDVPSWLECRVWLQKGEFPKFFFPNGPTHSDHALLSYILENQYTLLDKQQLAEFERANLGDLWSHILFFETPRIRIHQVEVSGPIHEQWPPVSHRAVFGDAPYTSEAAGEVLRNFAERAWRRTVSAREVEPILKLVRQAESNAVAEGARPEEAAQSAIKDGLQSVLTAPEFLYREERNLQLDGHEIASRLSYFLWSSLPDEALRRRAASGELARAEVRRKEAERLLADAKSDTFIAEFLDGWLRMHKLGTMAPVFPVYFEEKLEAAMRMETRLFFKRLLHSNGPIADFLDSDYTFVNRSLAKHYGIDWKTVEPNVGQPVHGLSARDFKNSTAGSASSMDFALVKLTDRRRGGLLGQGSVLTLTANGVDTSPVIRGAWLVKNLLGMTPLPPPPNVPVVEPDIRGATTVRERLEKHRSSTSCIGCHQLMDPPGFALETFDAIGGWRSDYKAAQKSLPIDPSGEFGGASFKDIVGFKELLLTRQPQFARNLVEKLLTHALGRELTVADRPTVRGIVEKAAKGGYRLRDLVLLCCESEALVRKSVSPCESPNSIGYAPVFHPTRPACPGRSACGPPVCLRLCTEREAVGAVGPEFAKSRRSCLVRRL